MLKAEENKSALVIGGRVNPDDTKGGQMTEKDYGALGQDSVTVGGADNTASGDAAVVVGGLSNTASAQYSTVVGGSANDAFGNESSVFGGFDNDAFGAHATLNGGSMNRAYGEAASVFGGSMNSALGASSVAVGGLQSNVNGAFAVGIAGGSTNADYALAAGNGANVTVENGTAIGYQATTDKAGTIAFGHDAGDAYYSSTTWLQKATKQNGKYYDANNKEITKAEYDALKNSDGTWNDYSKTSTVVEKTYDKAAYNRLVKVADGQDAHDVVVMEQLNNAKNDLKVNAGWGINVADVTTKNNDDTETTTKNVISLNRNLGTNYGNPWKGEGKVTFEAGGENSLILGGAASILFHNEADDVKAGAYGKDSVLVGGFNNLIDANDDDIYKIQTGEDSVIVGGDTNKVTGQRSVIVGGYKNTATGSQSVINGGASNIASGAVSSVFGGQQNTASGWYASVFGGDQNEASEEWSSAIGGITNTASGIHAVTLGGENNVAKGQKATTVGGTQNMAIGEWSLAAGGAENTSYGDAGYTAGGTHNMAYGNDSVALGGLKSNVNAKASTGIAGGSTGEKAITALAAGYQSVVTDSGVEWHTTTQADLDAIKQGLPWSGFTYTEDHDPYTNYVLDKISTAVGYQSTADAPGVIAFGHDKGDVASVAKKWKQKATMEVGDDYSAKFYDANHNEISSEEYYKLANADGTWNDYTQAPIGTEEKTYQSAYYNRLVKAADGIDAHDAVVMEQLKNASDVGNNIKVYKTDENGNVQFDENNKPIEDTSDAAKTNAAQKASEDAWAAAIGTGEVADPTTKSDTNNPETNGSKQLVTGGTVYNALQRQKQDLTKNLSVNAGWGINIADETDPKTGAVTKKNVISLDRNLGTNYGVTKNSNSKGKVTFETQGKNSLILGGSAINDTWYAYENDKNKYLDHAYGTFQDDSVLVGGVNNATGSKGEKTPSDHKGSVVVGGASNIASGNYALISGGSNNLANGLSSAILGGYKNEIPDSDRAIYSTIVGGTYNIASGIGATAVGGGNDIYNSLQYQNKASGSYSTTVGGEGNEASGDHSVTVGGISNNAAGSSAIVIGGFKNEAGIAYKRSSDPGAIIIGGRYNVNNGGDSVIFGGNSNVVNGTTSSVMGGAGNVAAGTITTVGGGLRNVASGMQSSAFGGYQSFVGGELSTGIAGGSTASNAYLSLAAGYQSVVTDSALVREGFLVSEEKGRELLAKVSTGEASGYYEASPIGGGEYWVTHYKNISTALGYQATADESGTIALGHDKGDTLITYKWPQKAWKSGDSYCTYNENTGGIDTISEEEYQKLQNSDGTWNDYTASPTAEKGPYDTAYYNRLVKAADGINAHDVVVMEQLTPYTKSNASNIGANLKTYTVGNDGETITEADASDADKTVNENAWGTAIGNGKIADSTESDKNNPKANGSLQLVTGGTVYSYNKPVAVPDKTLQYVKEGKTTGENLGILDATLNDKNHNIKYYAVDETTLPKLTNFNGKDYSNEKNDGANGMGSIAAGFNTHADGIISTVAGSYSGVVGTGFQGATALSYGTFNVNQNTVPGKFFSGVANSIVGQANATTDSNAAIIYGAGNTVTNSYRKIDDANASEIMKAALSKNVKKLDEALQKAVPTSGGQVMVMGGGNNVESAYMTQVVGVGNTVKGNQVQNTKSEWVTDNSIKDYNPEKSSQYNYVDGFSNEVINGKHDYVIGANNKLSGDSYDDSKAQPIKRSNRSNIVIGDNHILTREQNTVIIGSIDTEDEQGTAQDTQTKARDAVIIGHNANATNDTGADNAVAIGRSANATGGNAVTIGVNTSAGANSITIGSESSAISGSNIAIGRYARVYGDNVTNAVALGKLAEAHVAGGVAIGSNSIASTVAGKTGYDAQGKTHAATDADYAAWVSTDAAVSVGAAAHEVKYTDKDNKEQSKIVKSTRQITNLAAGTEDTDAVNVAQLKKLEGMKANVDASNIGENLKGADGKTASPEKITANKNAWGTALGVGMVADPTQSTTNDPTKNGSQQLVTGGTVFNETRISAKDDNGQAKTYNYLNANNSAGKNLEALDSALKTVSTTAGAHTVLTVEGNTPAGTGKDAKTNEDVYAGKNILLHESTDDTTGKVTYDLKLAKDINIGTPGKDGEDGKIGIDGRDGHIGLNGSDGITVRGLDGENGAPGKDGVTITGPKGADGIDGKVGISGTDGKDAVFISGKDGVGHIGLTGPAGTNGMDGADGKPGNSIDITVKNGYNVEGKDGKDGINGENGVDGTSLTRIVYKDATGEHQIATMEDGLKFEGDDDTVIAKKLNNTMEIIGGAKGDLTDGNIGVNSTDKGQLKVQLAKDLKGITSISNQKTEGDKTTGAKIDLGTDGSVNVNGGKITNVGSGADASGSYTTTTNAANIGDVQKIVKDAVDSASDTTNKALAGKANIDASNIGANLKGADGEAASAEDQKTNAENWGSAIGTGEIKADDGRMVTGKTVYDEVRPAGDGSYVKKDKTTGENLSALDTKIGKLDETKKYNYIDSQSTTSISDNLGKLDTQVKTNADNIANNTKSIQDITNNMQNLNENAVKYDNSSKSKVTLGGGKDGTTITNVKNGALSASSTDAVNGKQLYNEQQAREAADNAITEKVTDNTNEITKIENGEGFTEAGKTVIKNLSKDAVQVKAGDRIKVDEATDEKTGNKTYTISANNNGTVAKGNGNLISGDTLYNEVRPTEDGSYVKKDKTTHENLSALDKGLKTTSDLIHTNDKGDIIQIGGNSTATKIDVSGKDGKGNTTGRVITGVVSDANDPNSAANVGYVNGLTAANTQQIYRDMNNAYSRLDTNINRAAAGSNALAALHPLDFDPADKASFAVGYGHYHNANAAAVGAFYQPNANTMVNMGISLGNGDPGFNAGVSFKIGKGSTYNGVSKAEMAQTIHDQAAEISTIKANDAAKDKRIDALEKENQEMKKQIQEILARLNG